MTIVSKKINFLRLHFNMSMAGLFAYYGKTITLEYFNITIEFLKALPITLPYPRHSTRRMGKKGTTL